MTSGRAVLGRFVSRNLDWAEREEVDHDAAADLVNLCYENSLKEFKYAEDALTQTYVCFIRGTTQLEISVHSPSNATVTFEAQDVLARGILGLGRKPYTKEAAVRERDQMLQILRVFFHERDPGTLVSKIERLIGAWIPCDHRTQCPLGRRSSGRPVWPAASPAAAELHVR